MLNYLINRSSHKQSPMLPRASRKNPELTLLATELLYPQPRGPLGYIAHVIHYA